MPHALTEALRTAVCDLPGALAAADDHARKRRKLWGAAMGLAALAVGGGNTPLVVLFPPGAAASGVLAGALGSEALNRILRGD